MVLHRDVNINHFNSYNQNTNPISKNIFYPLKKRRETKRTQISRYSQLVMFDSFCSQNYKYIALQGTWQKCIDIFLQPVLCTL